LLKRQQEPDRDLITGLTIGDFVLGLVSYTVLSVKQERIMRLMMMRQISSSSVSVALLSKVGRAVNMCLDV
uniref:Cytochrome C oxidase assembly factor 3b n=1 Tax=Cyprinus carpio TaxID=7962 RepID=A0A8C1TSS1_CYPCA